MPSYNVHSHIFTMNNAPEHFLNLYLPDFMANSIGKITNTQVGSWVIRKLLSMAGNGGKRYANFLEIGKSRSQMEVFEKLIQQYPDEDMKFIALTMYMEKCGAGNSLSGFEGQLEEILEVKRRYPDRLLIFLGVDPRWKSNGIELKKTVETYFENKLVINAHKSVYPFAGLKLYPSTGFYAFDKNLKETFEWAAENGVPVLSHCYYKGGIYNNDTNYVKASLNPKDPYTGLIYNKPEYVNEKSWRWVLGKKASQNNKKTCSYFLEPEAYRSVLNNFNDLDKPLKLCFAHFGGAEEILRSKKEGKPYKTTLEPYGVTRKNWFEQIQDLMRTFKGSYTDISYTLYNEKVHPFILKELLEQPYGNRIMYGTDFYMTEQDMPERIMYEKFSAVARDTPSNKPGVSAWEELSENNTSNFLKSKYYS